jgi:hypothetical protein
MGLVNVTWGDVWGCGVTVGICGWLSGGMIVGGLLLVWAGLLVGGSGGCMAGATAGYEVGVLVGSGGCVAGATVRYEVGDLVGSVMG